MATGTIPSTYDPRRVEQRWYETWLQRGYFHAPVDPARRPFVIMMPLPNITGDLHIGHALNNTLQDVLIRWRRMQGANAMWMPGTDHASIGTHVVIERALAKEGKTRFDLGRDRFLEFTWRWKEKYGGIIYSQLKRLGVSCDWDRVTFTMDPAYADAVIEAFLRLYQKGYIYYGKRMINWCPHDLTSVSDLEVEYVATPSTLYHVRYPGTDGSTGIVIATQRPETILADVAVAVHPDDPRYRHLVGRTVSVPIVDRAVPVIVDPRVDPDFGTGAVKITPGHDPLDNEIGTDHGLPTIVILDEEGRMREEAGPYAGLDRFAAREAVAAELRARGLIEREEPYTTSVAVCERCQTVLEPYITDQWFVRMADLAAPAIRVVREGRVRFHPERWTRIFLEWMEHIRDWNISRRLWWGHQIPVWRCRECGETAASRERPARCARGHAAWEQEEQILDTWFSSALWPFATLGWPRETPELRYFYPGDVLATDRSIIFLWVARMIMFGLEFMGDVPFTDVYIHPTVLTLEGQRMSKSMGTGIDPMEMIDQRGYGADALRFALAVRCSQYQQDLRFSEKMLEDVRNFNNKIWNIARFVRLNLEGFDPASPAEGGGAIDRWIRSRYARAARAVTANLEAFEFDKTAKAIFDFLWSTYADWYVELAKVDLHGGPSAERRRQVQWTLWQVLEGTMRLLHPFMPHITEEVWHLLPHQGDSIMVQPWPAAPAEWITEAAEGPVERVITLIRAIRSLRADLGLTASAPLAPVLRPADEAARAELTDLAPYVAQLARAPQLAVITAAAPPPPRAAAAAVDGAEVFLPIGAGELETVRRRLGAELARVGRELTRVQERLDNPAFRGRAPAEIVAAEQQRQEDLLGRRDTLARYLAALA